MKRKKKKSKVRKEFRQERCCENCQNLIPIGEGDHICYECGPVPIMPICGYEWTDEYYQCVGTCFEGK